MIRLLVISILITLFIWIFNNYSSKNKIPISHKLNSVLKVIFIVLVSIGIILILPRFGFNPLALVQKFLPLIGML